MSTPSTTTPNKPYLSPASEARTALLLIDIQRGLNTSHGFFGTERSTPNFEENITSLLAACRGHNKTSTGTSDGGGADESSSSSSSRPPFSIEIVHVYHESTNPLSPLHVSGTAQKDGILFMPCAAPEPTVERVLSKSTSTAFGNAELEAILERKRIAQLIVAGIATDHCVSTSVRWANDLGVVKKRPVRGREDALDANAGDDDDSEPKGGEGGKIVILSDATACFNKGGFDAETIQKVHLASLEGEFAKVMSTSDVLAELFG